MVRYLLILMWCFAAFKVQAQEIQWASRVVAVSSESDSLKNTASQALGQPDVSPGTGDRGHAWHAEKADSPNEWIELGFETPIQAHQLVVVEAENAGSIKAIYAYDEAARVYQLYEATPEPASSKHHLLTVSFEMTAYKIASVKLVLDCSAVPGYNTIDAVGISASNVPINVMISINSHINPHVEVEKLDGNVNTSYNDHGPLLSPDGQILFFSRQLHPDNVGGLKDPEDIWYCRWDEDKGDWGPAENIGAPLNTKGPNFVASVAQDGNGMVLLLGNAYSRSGRMLPGASIARLDEDSIWSVPETLYIREENNLSDRADYFMTPSMNVLIMSIQREDSYGDRDLYVSVPEEDGSWSIPMNLGPAVNSEKEERAPFLTDDQISLYFTSEGRNGFGGEDVFVSKRLGEDWQSWSIAENLGAGVNTEGDEAYFNFPDAGKDAYFARGKQGEHDDIYRFYRKELYLEDDAIVARSVYVMGKIFGGSADVPVLSKISVTKFGEASSLVETKSDEDGSFRMPLTTGASYRLVVAADGYADFEQTIDLTQHEQDTLRLRDFVLERTGKAEVDVPLSITVSGKVISRESKSPVNAKITVSRVGDEATIGSFVSNENGKYEFQLPTGFAYVAIAEADGYDAITIPLDFKEASEQEIINKDLILTRTQVPLSTSAPVEILYFNFDQSNFQEENRDELVSTIAWLEANPTKRLEIHGHTDDVGDAGYNLSLSKRRAWSVFNFMVANGIAEDRLEIKHFGENRPLVAEQTPEARNQNRRVEFKVVEQMVASNSTINPIYFNFDQSAIDDGDIPELENILNQLKAGKLERLEIQGHTDAVGSASYNQTLSQHRAEAVYHYLVDHGIAANRLEFKGFGESKLLSKEVSKEANQKNRRVEFVVLDGPSMADNISSATDKIEE